VAVIEYEPTVKVDVLKVAVLPLSVTVPEVPLSGVGNYSRCTRKRLSNARFEL